MRMSESTSWLLFPPADAQETTYPRAFDAETVHLNIDQSSESEIRNNKWKMTSSPPVWWDRAKRPQHQHNMAKRALGSVVSSDSSFEECMNKTNVAEESNLRRELPRQGKALCPSNSGDDDYDSDSTVVKWGLDSTLSSQKGSPPSDSSDKENQPPRNIYHPWSKNRPVEPLVVRRVEVSPGSRNSSLFYHKHPSHGQHSRESSPNVSPRPFLRRSVPSCRYVTTPLQTAPFEKNDSFSQFDLKSKTWTSLVTSGEGRILARHTLVLDLILPPKRWLTDTVLLNLVATHGPWLEAEVGIEVQNNSVDLSLTEASKEIRRLSPARDTRFVFALPKADFLKSTLTVNVIVPYVMDHGALTIAFPKFQPAAGALLMESFHVRNPEKPLVVVRDDVWQPLTTEYGNFWANEGQESCNGLAATNLTVKWIKVLEIPRLSVETFDVQHPIAWDFVLSLDSLASVAMTCHMEFKINPWHSWEKPLFIIHPCSWEMAYWLLDEKLPASSHYTWHIDLDGSLVLSREGPLTSWNILNIEIFWEMPWSDIDAFHLNDNGLPLPLFRSHRILGGSVATSIGDALLKIRCGHESHLAQGQDYEDIIIDARRSPLPTIESGSPTTVAISGGSLRCSSAFLQGRWNAYTSPRCISIESSLEHNFSVSNGKKSDLGAGPPVSESKNDPTPEGEIWSPGKKWIHAGMIVSFGLGIVLLGTMLTMIVHERRDSGICKSNSIGLAWEPQRLENDPRLQIQSQRIDGAWTRLRSQMDELLGWAWLTN